MSSAGASEPLYFDDDGQPVFAHMVSVPHANKHLIKFPIALGSYNTEELDRKLHYTSSDGVAQGRHWGQC